MHICHSSSKLSKTCDTKALLNENIVAASEAVQKKKDEIQSCEFEASENQDLPDITKKTAISNHLRRR